MINTKTNLQFFNTPDHHKIAYAIIGSPALTPILFLHGGPGSDSNPVYANYFNLERHCVIMFDQRGCGRSTPTGDISNNTTQYLIDDIEQLRQTLNIKHWIVYGGSWGAALALEYAKQHPAKVISILLRGSFLARKQDVDWFVKPGGVATQHPKAYKKLVSQLNPDEGQALTSRLYYILQEHPTPYAAALAWDCWESIVMGVPTPSAETDLTQQRKRIAAKLIYAHYCHHQFFLDERGVMPNLDALENTPVHLIHGKHDQVCPLSAAQALNAALPNSKLVVVDAGHGLHEKNIKQALWEHVSH